VLFSPPLRIILEARLLEDDTMTSVPAMLGLAAMGRDDRPALNVPIVMCPKCKRRPMAIKTVHEPLLGKGPAHVDMICPECNVVLSLPTDEA
jgi:hypothetical protein